MSIMDSFLLSVSGVAIIFSSVRDWERISL
jgi:hypothetical protein